MNQFGYPESDWKLYKSKIADWQEGYMEKLCKEYIELLSSDKLPSERFWELEKRIRDDKRDTGVVVTNSRSKVIDNILDLLHEGAITLDDLSDFSEELQERSSLYIAVDIIILITATDFDPTGFKVPHNERTARLNRPFSVISEFLSRIYPRIFSASTS